MFAKIILIINLILMLIIIICEHKNLRPMFFWCVISFCFGMFGFLFYIIFGNRLKFKAKRQLLNKRKSTKNYIKYTCWYNNKKKDNKNKLNKNQIKISRYLLNNFNCSLWHNNKLKLINSGDDFLECLIKDIQNAKKFILIEFYIFLNDKIGNVLSTELIKKAKEGIEINLLYDAIGSKNTPKKFFKKLNDFGINVCEFFPSIIKASYFNFKINYRNHRKIVIIDGKTSYIGGFNIRKDHFGYAKKLSPWKDSAVKIYGSATYALTDIFLNDWCYAKNIILNKDKVNHYFPKTNNNNGEVMQIVESGADKDNYAILESYTKIINLAKDYLYILTPYFIVGEDLLKAIIQAKQRGVYIVVIIPKKPDKKLVYAGTIKCLKSLLDAGIKIYMYNGFLHSKIVLNEDVLSIGSANFDNRSFKLNFEANAIIYSKDIINKQKQEIDKIITQSIFLTNAIYKKLSIKGLWFKILYYMLKELL